MGLCLPGLLPSVCLKEYAGGSVLSPTRPAGCKSCFPRASLAAGALAAVWAGYSLHSRHWLFDLGALLRESMPRSFLLFYLFILSWRYGRRTNRYSIKAIEHLECSGVPFSLPANSTLFSLVLKFCTGKATVELLGVWSIHWTLEETHSSVPKSDHPRSEGGKETLGLQLKLWGCQSRVDWLKLLTDPDTLLSWTLFLLRQCWLTAFLLFSFLF